MFSRFLFLVVDLLQSFPSWLLGILLTLTKLNNFWKGIDRNVSPSALMPIKYRPVVHKHILYLNYIWFKEILYFKKIRLDNELRLRNRLIFTNYWSFTVSKLLARKRSPWYLHWIYFSLGSTFYHSWCLKFSLTSTIFFNLLIFIICFYDSCCQHISLVFYLLNKMALPEFHVQS